MSVNLDVLLLLTQTGGTFVPYGCKLSYQYLRALSEHDVVSIQFGFRDVDVKRTGTKCSIPNNPKARLMYYLRSMCNVLNLNGTSSNLACKLTNYNNYANLTRNETKELMVLCALLNPIVLTGKCIFPSDELCGDFDNEFFEINSKRTTFAAVSSVMIGSVRASVNKIMTYKMCWLKKNYLEPMERLNP